MEASGRSYQDAICGAFVAALCYMKARHHHHQQQQQQQFLDQQPESPQETPLSSPSSCHPFSTTPPSKCSSVVTSPPSRTSSFVTSTPSRTSSFVTSTPSGTSNIVTSTQSRTSSFITSTPSRTSSSVTSTPSRTSSIVTSTPSRTSSIVTSTPSRTSSIVTSTPSRTSSIVTSTPSRTSSIVTSTPSRTSSIVISTPSRTSRTKQKPVFEAEPLSTDWTQLEVIDLINDGTGLGFGIIGGRSTGVVVKTLLPGGIADMDGHLRTGDHILQIGDVSVRGMSSEQVALVLRQSGPHVRLVVARSVLEAPQFQIPHAPIIPTHQLEKHMEHFNAVMAMEAGEHELHLHSLHLHHQLQQYHYQQQQALYSSVQVHPQPIEMMEEMSDVSDVDVFEVILMKDSGGLGITIAGYVGRDNTPDEISGIFVKSIGEGSAADIDGRVHVHDQIIEVDGMSLQGFSNHQAVEVLRNTGQMVKLKLVRFNHGHKYDKLQEYLAQANLSAAVQPSPAKEVMSVSSCSYEHTDHQEIQNLMDDFSGQLSPDMEATLQAAWEPIVGNDFLVVVAQLAKFKEAGGLGISLEGTVDVEDGVEVRPHHYIRSILPDGPVGLNGRLKSGDELLEVNGKRLLGLNHISVVDILKDLPLHVRLVCARRKTPLPDCFTRPDMQIPGILPYLPGVTSGMLFGERLIKAKSEIALSASEPEIPGPLSKSKSRSLEPMMGLAMWSSQPVAIALEKGDGGLGFSILEYQDPANHSESVIVIRSLVPGGVAQLDGRLVPGDRLMFVNDTNLEHATQAEAVQALKQAKRGTVKIGVAKPLPLTEFFKQRTQEKKVTDEQSEPYVKDIAAPALTHEDSNLEIQSEDSADFLDCKCLDSSPSVNSLKYSFPPYDSSSFDVSTSDKSLEPEAHQQNLPSDEDVHKLNANTVADVKVRGHRLSGSKETMAENSAHGAESKTKLLALLVTNKSTELQQEDSTAHTLLSLAAPIAKLDSTEFESEQVPDLLQSSSATDPFITPLKNIIPATYTKLQEQDGQSSLLIYTQRKEAPLPLPAVSSPSVTRAQTPPLTPPLRPAPCSPKRFDLESKIHGRSSSIHRKTASSPSADHVTTSNIKTPPSPLRLLTSGVNSPELSRVSADLERTIHIQKANLHLGLTLETVDKGISCCIVKNISKPSAVDKDGRIQPGDYVLSINNESLKRITNAQVRAILRRSSLLGSDVTITYIPGPSLDKQSQMIMSSSKPLQSPSVLKQASSLKSEESTQITEQLQTLTDLSETRLSTVPDQKTQQVDRSSSIGGQFWGTPRVVQLTREPGKSLGISIVGGRVDVSDASQEHCNVGIYIKHVLADSPAGRNGTLKKGDRILEVSGCDVRNATHDEAVEAIRNSPDMITFVIQSLSHSCYYSDIEITQEKPVQLSQGSAVQAQSSVITSPGSSPQERIEQADFKTRESVSDNESEDEFGYSKRSVQRKYLDQPGLVQLIDLKCSSGRLGLELAGNKDRSKMSTFVAGVQPESPAAIDGRIQAGDEVLEINGISLHGLSHLNAAAIIKGQITSVVKLVIHRREDFLDHIAVKPLKYSSCSQYGVPSTLSRGSADTDNASSSISRRESSATSYSPSPSATAVVASPSLAQSFILEETVQMIILNKPNSQGLGFGIHEVTKNGRSGIYVKSITEGGIADKDQRLEVGDEILEVGDTSLVGLHYDKAIDILRAAQGSVHLKVHKVSSSSRPSTFTTAGTENSQGKVQLLNTSGDSSTDPVDSEKSEDPRTCPIEPGKCTYIEIEKIKKGLGLGIVGGSDTQLGAVIIHEVYKEGAAAKDKRLRVGDQILEVNGEDIRDVTHAHALQVLRQTPPTVKMIVHRRENWVKEEDILDVFSVDLIRRPGRGLGFSIKGKKNGRSVFISDIVKGGAAEADGHLMHGDQILAVNGDDLRNSTQEYVAIILKTLMGKVSLSLGRLKADSKISSQKNSSHSTSLKKSDSSTNSRSKKQTFQNDKLCHQKVGKQDKEGPQKVCLDNEPEIPDENMVTSTVSKNAAALGADPDWVKSGDKKNVNYKDDICAHRSSKVTPEAGQEELVSLTHQRSRPPSRDAAIVFIQDVSVDFSDDGHSPQFKTKAKAPSKRPEELEISTESHADEFTHGRDDTQPKEG